MDQPTLPAPSPNGEPLNILDIDAVSFAARVAQVAAAEICGLLTAGEPIAVPDWYKTEDSERDQEKIAADIEAMAAYVVTRGSFGEQLWRWNTSQKRTPKEPDWTGVELADRIAYDLFCTTMRQVHRAIVEAQAKAQRTAEEAARAPAPGLKREDSIFEEETGLGEQRPEAVEAARFTAERKQAEKEAARLKRRLEAARKRQEKAKAAAEAAAAELAGQQQAMAAMSAGAPAATIPIGEAPPAPPVNRGGRGKRKGKNSSKG